MTQSMIGSMACLVILLAAGFMVARHYGHARSAGGASRWLDTHHINWMSRQPDADPKNDKLP